MSVDRSASLDRPSSSFRRSRVAAEVDEIVAYVGKTRGLGLRAARRYVGRRLTPVTLAWWRAVGRFPVGFRNRDPQLHLLPAEYRARMRAVTR